ncbi:MAG: PLP-dependent transferase, partial [Actinomycetota bacterium]|nr:PLP-dependent transferase [Actinomycetota bacterium]
LNTPLVLASNFQPEGDHYYARSDGTATVDAFEELVGGLEGGTAVAYASGLAACSAVFDQLEVGSIVAIPFDCYQGVSQLAAAGAERGRWTVREIAVDDTATWAAALGDCALVWLESPSNPLLEVADLEAICRAPRSPEVVVAVDNTFATPLNQRPLALGADVVVHSATKFIGGHSDLLSGVAVAADPALVEALRSSRTLLGASPGALETFLATRGARTLALRLDRSQANAAELARRLEAATWVATVRYPGLVSHPTHEVATRVLHGYGAMLSFDVVGTAEQADAFVGALRLVHGVTSLGGVESTIERRARLVGQEHLPPTLLRLSAGCEHVDDLWRDLQQAASSLGSGPGTVS